MFLLYIKCKKQEAGHDTLSKAKFKKTTKKDGLGNNKRKVFVNVINHCVLALLEKLTNFEVINYEGPQNLF